MLNLLLTLALAISLNIVGAYIAVLVHECGHAIAGRLAGFYVTSFGAGTGRPLFFLRLRGGTIFYIGRDNPWQGLTWATSPCLIPPRRKTALLLLGGPLANLLLGGLYSLALFQLSLKGWILAVLVGQLVGNIMLGLGNLLPLSITLGKMTLRSDGAQSLALLPRRGAIRPLHAPDSYLSLRPLWESIGDTTQLYVNLLTAALTVSDLKDHPQARRLLQEARIYPFPENILPLHRAYGTLVEGVILQEEGDLSGGVRLIQQAEAEFAMQGNETLRLLATASREDADALPLVAAFTDHPLLARSPSIRTALTAAHLFLTMRYGTGDIETLLARYEAAHAWYRYAPTDWQIYSAVAQYREGQGDLGGAAIAYEKAARAGRSIFETLENDPVTQKGFAERVQPVLSRGAHCLETLGRRDEATILRTLVPSAEGIPAWRETAMRQAEDREHTEISKERRQFGFGLTLWAFDFILAALAILTQWLVQPEVAWMSDALLSVFISRLISITGCLIVLFLLAGRWLISRKPLYAGKTAWYLYSVVGTAWIILPLIVRR